MLMRTLLAGIFTLATSAAFAQSGSAPKPSASENSPPTTAGREAAVPMNQAEAGQPANLCQELVAFLKAPSEKNATPAKPAAAEKPPQSPAEETSTRKETSALAGTAHTGAGATAKPEREADSSQAVTGQKGVATDAPEPSDQHAAAGSVANAPQKESRSAPLPPADVTSAPKESVITLEKAEALADANDIAECQGAARKMRVAGIAMPPPLIALAALDLRYQAGGTSAPQEPIAQPAP